MYYFSNGTPFSEVYASFLSKITDDMYMELTPQDTDKIIEELLFSALPKFEFPRKELSYTLEEDEDDKGNSVFTYYFNNELTQEEINIISTYMIVEWIGQQLASIENVRMKYSGSDFKFTSQANHMQKLLQMKKDYEREGFHLQRLYKRRRKDTDGIFRSTLGDIMTSHQDYTFEKQVPYDNKPNPIAEDKFHRKVYPRVPRVTKNDGAMASKRKYYQQGG